MKYILYCPTLVIGDGFRWSGCRIHGVSGGFTAALDPGGRGTEMSQHVIPTARD